jgi:hypothetical protein
MSRIDRGLPSTGVGAGQNVGPAAAPTPASPAASPAASQAAPAGALRPETRADERPTPGGVGTGQRAGIAGLTAHFGAAELSGPSMIELIPGRYPDAVSLPAFLKGLAGTPEGQAAVTQIVGAYTEKTGIPVPESTVTAILAKPDRLIDLLAATPKQMSAGVDTANLAYKQGKLKPLAKPERKLPQSFSLTELDSAPFTKPQQALKAIAPGLFVGTVPSELSETQVRRNSGLAEVFDRLAANAALPAEQRFTAKLGGQSYTSLEGLVAGLAAQGYEISATVEHRIANFAGLMTQKPDGTIVDVPAPAMVRTGVKKGNKEAVVPATHSELVIRVRPGANAPSGAIDGEIKFYQGISGTGFFPVGLERTPPWCGRRVADTFSGAKAKDAVLLAGTLSQVINAVADEKQLAIGGYGATGVCNDSVAVVQKALTGRTTAYPLLMRDALLADEVKQRKTDGDTSDDARLGRLEQAIRETPSDAVGHTNGRRRALASLPWSPGQEPFESTVTARELLSGG